MKELEALDILNSLLNTLNITVQVTSMSECAPLLWVALTEALLNVKIPNIHRTYDQDVLIRFKSKFHNVNTTLEFLQSKLDIDLSHISAEKLLSSDKQHVINLIEIFHELYRILSFDEQLDSISEIQVEESFSVMSSPTSEILTHTQDYSDIVSQNEPSIVSNDPSSIRKTKQRAIGKKNSNGFLNTIDDVESYLLHDESIEFTQNANTSSKTKPKVFNDTLSTLKRKRDELVERTIHSKKTIKKLDLQHKHNLMTLGPYKVPLERSKVSTTQQVEEESSILDDLSSLYPAEQDIQTIKSKIQESICPTVPENIIDSVYTRQLKGWKSALNDRIWRKKAAQAHKGASRISTKLMYMEKQSDRQTLIDESKQDREIIRLSKTALSDRQRALVRMNARQQTIERDIMNCLKVKEQKEQTIVHGVFNDYLNKQRMDIIEKRRFVKDYANDIYKHNLMKHESMENEYFQQIQMFKEKLYESECERNIMIKAHEQEMRKMRGEQKDKMKSDINDIKESLVGQRDEFIRGLNVDKLEQSIRVDVRRMN